jgi:hypothetical protein
MDIISVFDYKGNNLFLMGIVLWLCAGPCVIIQCIKLYLFEFDKEEAKVINKTDYLIGIILLMALVYVTFYIMETYIV